MKQNHKNFQKKTKEVKLDTGNHKQFKAVWFSPKDSPLKANKILAMNNSGILSIVRDSIEYQGKKQHVKITNIESLELGKQGEHSINNWVKTTSVRLVSYQGLELQLNDDWWI
jgi:hypothetical protein